MNETTIKAYQIFQTRAAWEDPRPWWNPRRDPHQRPAEFGAKKLTEGQAELLAVEALKLDDAKLWDAKTLRYALDVSNIGEPLETWAKVNAINFMEKWGLVNEARDAAGALTIYAVPLAEQQQEWIKKIMDCEQPEFANMPDLNEF